MHAHIKTTSGADMCNFFFYWKCGFKILIQWLTNKHQRTCAATKFIYHQIPTHCFNKYASQLIILLMQLVQLSSIQLKFVIYCVKNPNISRSNNYNYWEVEVYGTGWIKSRFVCCSFWTFFLLALHSLIFLFQSTFPYLNFDIRIYSISNIKLAYNKYFIFKLFLFKCLVF